MKKTLLYLTLFVLSIAISGCTNNNPKQKTLNNPISKKILKANKDFTINEIGSKKKKYTKTDGFIMLSTIREFQIIKSLNDELLLAIDKDGILSHRIIEHNKANFSISPYSYIVTPYTIKFK